MFVGVGPTCTDIVIITDNREEGVEEFLVRMDENPLEAVVRIIDVCKYLPHVYYSTCTCNTNC